MEYTTGMAVFNDWIITREIGQGATGHVYEIKKNGYGEEIRSALKVIRIPKSPSDIKAVMSEGMTEDDVTDYFKEFVDEILREIKIMVSLREHPNIVTYEDHSVINHEDGIGWDILIKMELLTPLQEWQMEHPMNEHDIIRLGCEISSALSYAADHNLIHRDVKPENIFVDSFGKFKLGDFGIARTIEKTTGGLSKKGTESYMAPEVYLGKKYNAQVDIYSLGVVLYRFLNNNRLPFYPPITEKLTYSDKENALMKRIKGLPIPEPANGNTELKAIVLKCCEYLPENRYASMSELHNALQKIEDPWGPNPPDTNPGGNKKKVMIGIVCAMIVVAVSIVMIGIFYGKTKKHELSTKDEKESGEYQAGEKSEVTVEETMEIAIPEKDTQAAVEYVDNQYKLIVKNGDGGGEYKAGEKVKVTANTAEEGTVFSGWSIEDDIEHSDIEKESLEIIMPERDVEISAQYDSIEKYKVIVGSGKGSGEYQPGEKVTITAREPKKGCRFKRWEIKSGNFKIADLKEATSSFIMPNEDVEVTATYEDMKYKLTVDGGSGSGYYTVGEVASVTANATPNLEKYEFAWKITEGNVNDTTIGDPHQLSTTVLIPAHDMTISYDIKMYLTSEDGYSIYVPAPEGWGYYGGWDDDLSDGMISTGTYMDTLSENVLFAVVSLHSYDPSTEYIYIDEHTALTLDDGKTVYYKYEDKDGEGHFQCIYIPKDGEVLSYDIDSKMYEIKEKYETEENLVRILLTNVEPKEN